MDAGFIPIELPSLKDIPCKVKNVNDIIDIVV